MNLYLRRSDDDGTVYAGRAEVLHYRQVFIGGPWGRVHHQVIHISPVYVTQELLDQT